MEKKTRYINHITELAQLEVEIAEAKYKPRSLVAFKLNNLLRFW